MLFGSRLQRLKEAGVDVVVIANHHPMRWKQAVRESILAAHAKNVAKPLVYANAVGGQDELVFDGTSFAVVDC